MRPKSAQDACRARVHPALGLRFVTNEAESLSKPFEEDHFAMKYRLCFYRLARRGAMLNDLVKENAICNHCYIKFLHVICFSKHAAVRVFLSLQCKNFS